MGAVGSAIDSLPNHLPKLPFLGEFAIKDAEVVDKLLAGVQQSLTWGEAAVGLDTEDELAGGKLAMIRIRRSTE